MTSFPPLRRCLWYVAGLVCAFVLTIVWIHVQQHILLSRAERLLADARSLQLRKSTFADAQAIFARWQPWGDYKDPWYGAEQECTAERCAFNVTQNVPPVTLWNFLQRHDIKIPPFGWHTDAYKAVGGRLGLLRVFLRVRNGTVWAKHIIFAIDPPEGLTFGAQIVTLPRLYPVERYWREISSGQEYAIAPHELCDTCDLGVNFTPYASPEDIERLSSTLNLGCLTAWNPCRVQKDLLPAAVAERDADMERNLFGDREEFSCNPELVERIARDAENAAIVELTSITSEAGPRPNRFITLRLEQRLKNGTLWEIGAVGRVQVRERNSYQMKSGGTLEVLQAGKRVILLFGYKRDDPQAKEPWLELCGALPLNEANLALVQRGIAQDERSDEWDWRVRGAGQFVP